MIRYAEGMTKGRLKQSEFHTYITMPPEENGI